jgi:predicted RNase H-like HicB family nuclease
MFTMTKADYLIKLNYDPKYKGYVAECLNLYGCMSQGKTKKEALKNIEKAIKAFNDVVVKQAKGQEISLREVTLPHISLSA